MPLLLVDISAHSVNELQRWELVLLAHDFVIECRQSTHFGQADALSFLIALKKLSEDEDIVIAKIEQDVREVRSDIVRYLLVTNEDVQKVTEDDPELKNGVRMGQWSNFQVGSTLHAFHCHSKDLLVHESVLFIETQAMFPSTIQGQVLKKLPEGHVRVTKMRMLAWTHVYWQGIDIEDRVILCSSCHLVVKMPGRNELTPWLKPDCAWGRIHIDFVGPIEGMMFLIMVDDHGGFFKWPEVVKTKTSTSSATIKVLDWIFAYHGYPKMLVLDNGTWVAAKEFKDYCQKNGIQHIRSPSYQPGFNWQAEHFACTFKIMLQKLQGEDMTEDALQRSLLADWTAACMSLMDLKMPGEELLGRSLRAFMSDLWLKEQMKHLQRTDQEIEEKEKARHRQRREFAEEDAVFMKDCTADQNHPRWLFDMIKCRLGQQEDELEVNGIVFLQHVNQPRKQAIDDSLKIMSGSFDLSLLPPAGMSQVASEEANTPEPPEVPESEEVCNAGATMVQTLETRPNHRRLRRLKMDPQQTKIVHPAILKRFMISFLQLFKGRYVILLGFLIFAKQFVPSSGGNSNCRVKGSCQRMDNTWMLRGFGSDCTGPTIWKKNGEENKSFENQTHIEVPQEDMNSYSCCIGDSCYDINCSVIKPQGDDKILIGALGSSGVLMVILIVGFLAVCFRNKIKKCCCKNRQEQEVSQVTHSESRVMEIRKLSEV